MKFIAEKTPVSREAGIYVAVQVMFGDADGFEHFTLGPFTRSADEPALENLLELLKRLKKEGSEYYNGVSGFLAWFCGEEQMDEVTFSSDHSYWSVDESYEEFLETYRLASSIHRRSGKFPRWPSYTDEGIRGQLWKVRITESDGRGLEYKVKVSA